MDRTWSITIYQSGGQQNFLGNHVLHHMPLPSEINEIGYANMMSITQGTILASGTEHIPLKSQMMTSTNYDHAYKDHLVFTKATFSGLSWLLIL